VKEKGVAIFQYLKPMRTKFFLTSVGSPWGNVHNVRSIKTIKKAAGSFLIQEKCDEHINYFIAAHI
jgi:hypothetical protein